jgi:hypothetical protein
MESEHSSETVQPMPFLDKLAGFFLSPIEVFDNVARSGPTTSTWFVPWILYVLMSIFSGQLIVGNPSLSAQLEQTLRKQFDELMHESIIKGEITQAQADEQFERFGTPGSPLFTLVSVGGALFGSLVTLFAVSLFCLLLGRSAMSATAPYMKVVEVVGLTFLIDFLERIVTTALMFLSDSILASPSFALFLLPDVDLENKAHILLSKLNVFTFWKIGAVSLGLSQLFRRDFPKVLVLVVALWVLWSLFSLFTGFNPGS